MILQFISLDESRGNQRVIHPNKKKQRVFQVSVNFIEEGKFIQTNVVFDNTFEEAFFSFSLKKNFDF